MSISEPDSALFETDRLSVRRLAASDVPGLLEVYGDADAMRWVDDGQPITLEECERWVVVTARNVETRGYGMAVVEDRDSQELVGFCGLVHPGGQPEPEVKYALARRHWGRGYATEVVGGMVAYGREVFAMESIIATVAPANHASQRVLAKNGFARSEPRVESDGSRTEVFVWRAAGT